MKAVQTNYIKPALVPYIDQAGRTVHIGDLIVYGTSTNHSVRFHFAKVVAEKNLSATRYLVNQNQETPMMAKIQVHSAWLTWKGEAELGDKPVWLTNAPVLVVNESQIPQNLLKMLETIEIPY